MDDAKMNDAEQSDDQTVRVTPAMNRISALAATAASTPSNSPPLRLAAVFVASASDSS